MRILVNGAPREVPDGITVAALVRDMNGASADGRGVAVAVDAEVVPRGAWDSVGLAEGQRVEVVVAVQGG